MAAFTFNIAKGRVVELFLRAPNGIVVLLEQAESDAVLKDYDTLQALLASPGNVELAHASYSRKTGIAGVVSTDDALDQNVVDLPPQTFPALSGNTIVKVLVCFLHPTTGEILPLTGHDFSRTPDGSDLVVRFP